MPRYSQSNAIFNYIESNRESFANLVHNEFGYDKNSVIAAIMMYGSTTRSVAVTVLKKLEEAGIQI